MSVASPYAVFPPPRYVHSAKSMCGSYQPTNIQKELAFSYQRRSLLPTYVLKELSSFPPTALVHQQQHCETTRPSDRRITPPYHTLSHSIAPYHTLTQESRHRGGPEHPGSRGGGGGGGGGGGFIDKQRMNEEEEEEQSQSPAKRRRRGGVINNQQVSGLDSCFEL